MLGLLLYVVTMSFAVVDWMMLRELHWYSSILGLVVCVSQVLGAVVLAISAAAGCAVHAVDRELHVADEIE